MKTVIVIPAYNEALRISPVITMCQKYGEVIVVDDGSKDDTYDVASKTSALVLKHRVNLGKGAALKTGCDAALLLKADNIVVIDSDGQHDPDEIPSFIRRLKYNDIVFSKRIKRYKMPLVAKLGNDLFSFISKLLFKLDLRDPQSGYRAFTSSCYEKIRWDSSGYSVENEIIAKVGAKKIRWTKNGIF